MASILSKLQKASFRGEEFIYRTTSTTGGRKTVTHEYPNTNKRVVEDLGKLEKIFTITGEINNNNDRYFQKRDALIVALDKEGSGVFNHPTFGAINASISSYSLDENFNELNIAKFTMTFEKTEDTIYPVVSSQKTALIESGISQIQTLSVTDITNNFAVTSGTNFLDSQTKLENISSGLETAILDIFDESDGLNDYSRLIGSFSDNIVANINDPSSLGSDLIEIFQESLTAIISPSLRLTTFRSLFTFGDDDTVIAGINADQTERQLNRITLNNNIQTNSLLVSYDSGLYIDYKTVDDLNEVRNALVDQFQKLNNNDDIDAEIREILNEINNDFTEFYEQQNAILPRLITIKTAPMPMTILAHQYYGNLEDVTILIDINEERNPSFVAGELQVISNG